MRVGHPNIASKRPMRGNCVWGFGAHDRSLGRRDAGHVDAMGDIKGSLHITSLVDAGAGVARLWL